MKSYDLPIFTESERSRAHKQRNDATRNRQHSPGEGEYYDPKAAGQLVVEEVRVYNETDDEWGNAGVVTVGSNLDRVGNCGLVPERRGLILARRLFAV
jgi:hypothetical protein